MRTLSKLTKEEKRHLIDYYGEKFIMKPIFGFLYYLGKINNYLKGGD